MVGNMTMMMMLMMTMEGGWVDMLLASLGLPVAGCFVPIYDVLHSIFIESAGN